MELTQLRQFKTAAECGNLTKAANEILFISQPSLSVSIKKLEEELGCKLFDRNNNNLKLNEAGEAVLKYANNIFREVDFMKAAVEQIAGKQFADLNACSSEATILRHFIYHYNADNKKTINVFKVDNDSIRDMLLNENADVAFTTDPISDKKIDYMPLCTQRTYAVLSPSHPLAKRKYLTLKDLEGTTMLMLNRDNEHAPKALSDFYAAAKQKKININFIYQQDTILYNETFKNNDYVGLTNNFVYNFYSGYKNKKAVLISDKELTITYYINYLKKENAKVKAVREWIRTNHETLSVDISER